MAADKRTVHTDALETLGTIIDEHAKRDAIHLAVEPAIAGHTLYAGEHVGFLDETKTEVGRCDHPLGIVDPFVEGRIEPGQRFWLVIYPRKITSLRHVWSHPDFPDPQVDSDKVWHAPSDAYITKAELEVYNVLRRSDSEEWIRTFANRVGLSYQVLMDGAREWVESKRQGSYGEYLCYGGLLEGQSVPDEFWTHYQDVTGDTVEHKHRGSFFTCSC